MNKQPDSDAENNVRNFYTTVGWVEEEGITEDARRFEDLREIAKTYVSMCRLRVLKYIPPSGDLMLDMASGPIQFPEYIEYSRNFNKRYCVDLSSAALKAAERRIGDHGVFLNESFFDIDFKDDMFDCSLSLHTIYHMDAELQESAVRKLLKITKPNSPVIIIYSNPSSLVDKLTAQKFRSWLKSVYGKKLNQSELYFSPHSIEWWDRFGDVADLTILPWRAFTNIEQKYFFPNNRFGEKMFKILYWLEDRFPNFFARNFRYPMIVLKKRLQ